MPRNPDERLQNLDELIEKKFREQWPYLSGADLYVKASDAARRIFFERLGETLEKLAEECSAQALLEVSPESKKKRPGRSVEHDRGRVWMNSILIAQWLELWGVPITKSLMAVAYYQEIDLSRADRKDELLLIYNRMRDTRRDQYSRNYDKLLESRELSFEELKEMGRQAAAALLSDGYYP